MWINIISENFQYLVNTLKTKPFVIVVLGLMFVSGMFIHKWVLSKDDCTEVIRHKNEELIKLNDSVSFYKYESKYYQKLNKTNIDSIENFIRERIVKPLENSKK